MILSHSHEHHWNFLWNPGGLWNSMAEKVTRNLRITLCPVQLPSWATPRYASHWKKALAAVWHVKPTGKNNWKIPLNISKLLRTACQHPLHAKLQKLILDDHQSPTGFYAGLLRAKSQQPNGFLAKLPITTPIKNKFNAQWYTMCSTIWHLRCPVSPGGPPRRFTPGGTAEKLRTSMSLPAASSASIMAIPCGESRPFLDWGCIMIYVGIIPIYPYLSLSHLHNTHINLHNVII